MIGVTSDNGWESSDDPGKLVRPRTCQAQIVFRYKLFIFAHALDNNNLMNLVITQSYLNS